MSTKVIAIAAAKGGVSKSTICGALGVHAAAAGDKILLVDAEPQQSLGLWWERRGEPDNPSLVTVEGERELSRAVGKMRAAGQADFILIDTPPAMLERIEVAISLGDFVLIPVRASIFDVEAISPVVELCKDYGKPYAFVMSQADPKWKLLEATIDALEDYGPVFPEQVRYNAAYAVAVTTGKTGPEVTGKGGAEAREEIAALWKAIKRRLTGATKARVRA
jgi:chromosome partitioning protein